MLRLYCVELKKLRRQKIVRIIIAIGWIMPLVFTWMCVRDDLPYRSLASMLVTMGNFLVAPCLFNMLLAVSFQTEEQNNTLKNIEVTNVKRWKLLGIKVLVSFSAILLFVFISWVYSLIFGNFFLRNFDHVFKALLSLVISAIASMAASMPIVIIIVLLRKKYLVSMIVVNCYTILNFIVVWQISMNEVLRKLPIPVSIAYKITYPLQILEYAPNLQLGLDLFYYPLFKGTMEVAAICFVSMILGMILYSKQEA